MMVTTIWMLRGVPPRRGRLARVEGAGEREGVEWSRTIPDHTEGVEVVSIFVLSAYTYLVLTLCSFSVDTYYLVIT